MSLAHENIIFVPKCEEREKGPDPKATGQWQSYCQLYQKNENNNNTQKRPAQKLASL